MSALKNLNNKRFHSLVVLAIAGEDSFHRKIWLCRCDCGKEKLIRSRHLLSGQTKTCGCGIGRVLPKPFLNKKRERHPRWKGGRVLRSDGYMMEYVKDGKYELSHRKIIREKFGFIAPDLVVHHVNEDKTDNSENNLQLLSRSEHAKHHNFGVRIIGAK